MYEVTVSKKKITLALFTKGNLVVKNIYSAKIFRVLHQTLPTDFYLVN